MSLTEGKTKSNRKEQPKNKKKPMSPPPAGSPPPLRQTKRIFSDEQSKDFWEKIHNIKNYLGKNVEIDKLHDLMYFMGCKLQELEEELHRVKKEQPIDGMMHGVLNKMDLMENQAVALYLYVGKVEVYKRNHYIKHALEVLRYAFANTNIKSVLLPYENLDKPENYLEVISLNKLKDDKNE